MNDQFIGGLVTFVDFFLKEGFQLSEIQEISTIGQIVANVHKLDQIKEDLIQESFKGAFDPGYFDINENYIDFMQVSLRNGESYAIAYNSPADYFNTFVGILWVIKLKNKLNIEEIPYAFVDFRYANS